VLTTLGSLLPARRNRTRSTAANPQTLRRSESVESIRDYRVGRLSPGPDHIIAPPGTRSAWKSAPMKIVRLALAATKPSETRSMGAAM
jgi:hypothetical protein